LNYIKRDIEVHVLSLSREYSCVLVTGPRQAGKTTMMMHIMEQDRNHVTLDDLAERNLAKNDPALFFQLHKPPILIDEAQYAPELFSHIKIAIDKGAAPGSFWLTGSQAFRMMELAQESLAGRVAILHMSGLSQHEIHGSGENEPFAIELETLARRKKTRAPAEMDTIYKRVWNGSLPGYASGKFTDRNVFYSSYVQTYIERDVSLLVPLVDKLLFHDFVRAAACRAGQTLNVHDIAKDVGVSDSTAKRWLQVLEKSDVIFYLRPYSNNLLKRTINTPKLYFFDTGLIAYLASYSSPEILQSGAISGHILENYAVSEIIKSYHNNAQECLLWYYRDKENNEIDMIMESDGKLHPLEIKRSVNPGSELARVFSILDKGAVPRGNGALVCMRPELSAVSADVYVVPIWMI
jgi:predicted AAA+ superfamily ATPase